jgi:amino acid transporter
MRPSEVASTVGDVSNVSMKSDAKPEPEGAKTLKTMGLVFVAYFWVSGGMYGVEPLLKMAPPAYVFLTILIAPIIYSIPIALICTDLAVAYPYDGGFVAWVNLALGSKIGAHNMFWFVYDAFVLLVTTQDTFYIS